MESSSLEEQNLAPKLSRAGVYRAIANIADIGTSPFYAVNAIIVAIYLVGFGVGLFTTETMVNAMSFLFWTNTALITGKYAFLYLRYTWHGEGGVAALTSLVKSVFQSKVFQLIITGLSMIACATMVVNNMITTPITTGSAGASFFAEGTAGNRIFASICVVGIVWVISLGVKKASNIISPFMLAWFVFLFFSGIYGISKYPTILNFFNPVHAVMFVKNFLGLSVGITALLIVLNKEFLTKTGGEAFYAGVAQYGAWNLRIAWLFAKICIMTNYAGQFAMVCIAINTSQINFVEADGHGATFKAFGEISSMFYALVPQNTIMLLLATGVAMFASIFSGAGLFFGGMSQFKEMIHLKYWFWMKETNGNKETPLQTLYKPLVYAFGGIWLLVIWNFTPTYLEGDYVFSVVMGMIFGTILLYMYNIMECFTKKSFGSFVMLIIMTGYLILEGTYATANIYSYIHDGRWLSLSLTIGVFWILLSIYIIRKYRASKTNSYSLEDFVASVKSYYTAYTSIPTMYKHGIIYTKFENGVEQTVYHVFKSGKLITPLPEDIILLHFEQSQKEKSRLKQWLEGDDNGAVDFKVVNNHLSIVSIQMGFVEDINNIPIKIIMDKLDINDYKVIDFDLQPYSNNFIMYIGERVYLRIKANVTDFFKADEIVKVC